MQFNKWMTCALFMVSGSASAQNFSTAGESAIDSYMLQAQITEGIPGMVALVVNKDGVILEKAYGKMHGEKDKPMATDAIFRLASMTKPITAAAIMMLVDDGKVSLDAPLSQYMPELGNRQVYTSFDLDDGSFTTEPAKTEITIRHLLTHTSGLSTVLMSPVLAKATGGNLEASAVDYPLLFEPGSQWAYGEGPRVLGDVIERVTGQGLFEFMQMRIFGPLQMNDTGYDIPAEKNPRLVTVWLSDGTQHTEVPNPTGAISEAHYGDTGLSSTARDYAQFIRLFLNNGTLNGQQLLKPETIETMGQNNIGGLRLSMITTDPTIFLGNPLVADVDTFSLGFLRTESDVRNMRSPGSLSWGGVFNTVFWIDTEREIGAVLMMQFLPLGHESAMNVMRGFEEQIYTNLEP